MSTQTFTKPYRLTARTLLLCCVLTACSRTDPDGNVRTPRNDQPGKELYHVRSGGADAGNSARTLSLFDGKSLDGWNLTNFGGEGDVDVVDGAIQMQTGYPLTGINRDRSEELPTSNYEISLQARRRDGIDFFCGLTFPVNQSWCSLVVAGWAGATVGLSCVDGKDASSNETTSYHSFENDRWYTIRIRVDERSIACWIDGEQVINQPVDGHEFSVRSDVLASRPLGLCAFESTVEYRDIKIRRLAAEKRPALSR